MANSGALKLVLLGNTSVGKTSLLDRAFYNTFNPHKHVTTSCSPLIVKVEFEKKVEEEEDDHNNRDDGDEGEQKEKKSKEKCVMKFDVWDTAGQERYGTFAPMYYRNAIAALIVYDITNRDSFLALQKWIDDLRLHCNSSNIVIALVGNKLDLDSSSSSSSPPSPSSSQPHRRVTTSEAVSFASSHDSIHHEVSAKTGEGVKELLKMVAEKVEYYQNQVEKKEKEENAKVQLESNQHVQSTGSCGC